MWYKKTSEEIELDLKVNIQTGLSTDEAKRRLEENGRR